jgi:predicted FMN-binding regulatory protein PaiB
MMDYPAFRAGDGDVAALLADQRMVRLITVDVDGWPRVGVHVHTSQGLDVEVHLVRADPALEDIARSGRALIEVDEVMASAPSHWVDDENASHADQFYRCAVLRGEVELTTDRAQIAEHLSRLLVKQQPEGRYVPLDERPDLYGGYLDRLTLVRMRTTRLTTKFKLAQRTPREARTRIVTRLRERGSPIDFRTADAIEEVRPRET